MLDWTRGVYIPRETRPANHNRGFTFHVSLSVAFRALFCGVLQFGHFLL